MATPFDIQEARSDKAVFDRNVMHFAPGALTKVDTLVDLVFKLSKHGYEIVSAAMHEHSAAFEQRLTQHLNSMRRASATSVESDARTVNELVNSTKTFADSVNKKHEDAGTAPRWSSDDIPQNFHDVRGFVRDLELNQRSNDDGDAAEIREFVAWATSQIDWIDLRAASVHGVVAFLIKFVDGVVEEKKELVERLNLKRNVIGGDTRSDYDEKYVLGLLRRIVIHGSRAMDALHALQTVLDAGDVTRLNEHARELRENGVAPEVGTEDRTHWNRLIEIANIVLEAAAKPTQFQHRFETSGRRDISRQTIMRIVMDFIKPKDTTSSLKTDRWRAAAMYFIRRYTLLTGGMETPQGDTVATHCVMRVPRSSAEELAMMSLFVRPSKWNETKKKFEVSPLNKAIFNAFEHTKLAIERGDYVSLQVATKLNEFDTIVHAARQHPCYMSNHKADITRAQTDIESAIRDAVDVPVDAHDIDNASTFDRLHEFAAYQIEGSGKRPDIENSGNPYQWLRRVSVTRGGEDGTSSANRVDAEQLENDMFDHGTRGPRPKKLRPKAPDNNKLAWRDDALVQFPKERFPDMQTRGAQQVMDPNSLNSRTSTFKMDLETPLRENAIDGNKSGVDTRVTSSLGDVSRFLHIETNGTTTMSNELLHSSSLSRANRNHWTLDNHNRWGLVHDDVSFFTNAHVCRRFIPMLATASDDGPHRGQMQMADNAERLAVHEKTSVSVAFRYTDVFHTAVHAILHASTSIPKDGSSDRHAQMASQRLENRRHAKENLRIIGREAAGFTFKENAGGGNASDVRRDIDVGVSCGYIIMQSVDVPIVQDRAQQMKSIDFVTPDVRDSIDSFVERSVSNIPLFARVTTKDTAQTRNTAAPFENGMQEFMPFMPDRRRNRKARMFEEQRRDTISKLHKSLADPAVFLGALTTHPRTTNPKFISTNPDVAAMSSRTVFSVAARMKTNITIGNTPHPSRAPSITSMENFGRNALLPKAVAMCFQIMPVIMWRSADSESEFRWLRNNVGRSKRAYMLNGSDLQFERTRDATFSNFSIGSTDRLPTVYAFPNESVVFSNYVTKTKHSALLELRMQTLSALLHVDEAKNAGVIIESHTKMVAALKELSAMTSEQLMSKLTQVLKDDLEQITAVRDLWHAFESFIETETGTTLSWATISDAFVAFETGVREMHRRTWVVKTIVSSLMNRFRGDPALVFSSAAEAAELTTFAAKTRNMITCLRNDIVRVSDLDSIRSSILDQPQSAADADDGTKAVFDRITHLIRLDGSTCTERTIDDTDTTARALELSISRRSPTDGPVLATTTTDDIELDISDDLRKRMKGINKRDKEGMIDNDLGATNAVNTGAHDTELIVVDTIMMGGSCVPKLRVALLQQLLPIALVSFSQAVEHAMKIRGLDIGENGDARNAVRPLYDPKQLDAKHVTIRVSHGIEHVISYSERSLLTANSRRRNLNSSRGESVTDAVESTETQVRDAFAERFINPHRN